MINGCIEYVEMGVSIFFEPGHVACVYCPILETYARNQCRKTGEYIIDPRVTVGRYCPLKEKERKDGEKHREQAACSPAGFEG